MLASNRSAREGKMLPLFCFNHSFTPPSGALPDNGEGSVEIESLPLFVATRDTCWLPRTVDPETRCFLSSFSTVKNTTTATSQTRNDFDAPLRCPQRRRNRLLSALMYRTGPPGGLLTTAVELYILVASGNLGPPWTGGSLVWASSQKHVVRG